MLKTLTFVLAFAVLALVLAAAGLMPARAQGLPAKPAGVSVAAGAQPGEVTVSWQAAEGATFYRVGWVTFDDITAVRDAGRHWLDAFAFTDATNYGQTAHQLKGLLPGARYAFIVGSVNGRFGTAAWSPWSYLTTAEGTAQCPAGAGEPPEPEPGATPRPGPTATPGPTPDPEATPTPDPTLTPTPVPVGTDYDRNDNGLIEITSLAQLDAIRHDLDGDGVSAHVYHYHGEAFPNAMTGMGCLEGCSGYELTADLDFDTNGNGVADEGDVYWRGGYGWLPIGDPESDFRFSTALFNTTFDGNRHTIANLYIRLTEDDHIGLFRATGEYAEIRNVHLTGVRVSGEDLVGGLVGINEGSIAGSSVAGQVSGAGWIGGLAGYNSGNIASSNAATAVFGTDIIVGGLVGDNPGTIADSYASGTVTGEEIYVGGLVGRGWYYFNRSGRIYCGTISGSYATGNVTGGHNVGGLIGENCGVIDDSHATGSVTGGYYVGGLVGDDNNGIGDNNHGSSITASYATGNVTGNNSVGGLVGIGGGTITASYATGNVAGESNYVGGLTGSNGGTISGSYATGGVTGSSYVGGLSGYSYWDSHITASYAIGQVTGDSEVGGLVGSRQNSSARTTASYWDTQTTGQSSSSSGIGKTTRELQRPTGPTGIYADWDPEYWDFGTSRQYPVLKYDGMDVAAQRR